MKKAIIVILLLLLLLIGCSKNYTSLKDQEFFFEFEKSEDFSVEDDKNAFSLFQKMYELDGSNVEIVQLRNNSENDYDVLVTANYFDGSGKIIKEEKTSVSGFSAKTNNFLIFNPGITFSECTCSLTAHPSERETYLKYMSSGSKSKAYLGIDSLKEMGVSIDIMPEKVDEIVSKIIIESSCSKKLIVSASFAFFDQDDNLVSINSVGNKVLSGEDHILISLMPKAEKNGDQYMLPSNFENELSYISSFTSVEPWE